MTKKKKAILIVGICVHALAITIAILLFLINSFPDKTYSEAKTECEKVLDMYQPEMEQIALDCMKSEEKVSGDFKKYDYNFYPKDDFVTFGIDAQGMLGGQYWDLIYTSDGTFKGMSEAFSKIERPGNDIVRAEKLNEHWWFYWIDYDMTEKSYQ